MFALLGTFGGLLGLNPLGKAAKLVGGLMSLVLIIGVLWGAKALYDKSVIDRFNDRTNVKVLKKQNAANENAAEQRGEDTRTIEQQREELRNAQANSTDDADRRRRRACTILRQQGRDTSTIRGCSGL